MWIAIWVLTFVVGSIIGWYGMNRWLASSGKTEPVTDEYAAFYEAEDALQQKCYEMGLKILRTANGYKDIEGITAVDEYWGHGDHKCLKWHGVLYTPPLYSGKNKTPGPSLEQMEALIDAVNGGLIERVSLQVQRCEEAYRKKRLEVQSVAAKINTGPGTLVSPADPPLLRPTPCEQKAEVR